MNIISTPFRILKLRNKKQDSENKTSTLSKITQPWQYLLVLLTLKILEEHKLLNINFIAFFHRLDMKPLLHPINPILQKFECNPTLNKSIKE